jgi:diguanylate cyclase (GGDEF)-like protein
MPDVTLTPVDFDPFAGKVGGGSSSRADFPKVSPDVQLERDKVRLSMLQAEQADAKNDDPATAAARQREINLTAKNIENGTPFGTDKPASRGTKIAAELRESRGPKPLFPLNPETPAVTLEPVNFDPFAAPAPTGGPGVVGRVKDAAIDVAKGTVSLGESAVGLGDIATFGAIGKGLSELGYDPKATQEFLSGLQSDSRKKSEAEVQKATGFWDTAVALGMNPSVLIGNIVQSLPGTVASGAVAGQLVRRLAATATAEAATLGLKGDAATAFVTNKVKDATIKIAAAASATEGAQSAGSIAEAGRQAGSEWDQYVSPALAAGLGTTAIGITSGGVARKLGIGDVETDIAARAAGVKGAGQGAQSFAKRVPIEAAKEGLLEEMPQSAQEKVFENLATGRPPGEGVESAAAQGMMAGGGMGGGHAAITGGHGAPAAPQPVQGEAAAPPVSQQQPVAPTGPIEPTGLIPDRPPLPYPGQPDPATYTRTPESLATQPPAPLPPPMSRVEQARADANAIQSGTLPAGIDESRIDNARLVSVYGENAAVRHVIESGNMGALGQAMLAVAPQVERVRATIQQGQQNRDITTDVMTAIDEIARIRKEGKTVAEVLAHGMPGGTSYEGHQLAQYLDANLDNPQAIAKFMENYLQVVEDMGGVPSDVRGKAFDIIAERKAAKREAEKAHAFAQKEGSDAEQKKTETQIATEQARAENALTEMARARVAGAGINPEHQTAMEIAFANAAAKKGKKNVQKSNSSSNEGGAAKRAGSDQAGAGQGAEPATQRQERVPERAAPGDGSNARPVRASGNQPGAQDEQVKNRGEKIASERKESAKAQDAATAQAMVEAASREAAHSPHNDKPLPTAAQHEAGNYQKGHVTLFGLDIAIENPKGSVRAGVGPDGKAWQVKVTAPYGYIKRTVGGDNEHIDVYLGEHLTEDAPVFVIDQRDPATGKFDEHKVVLGARGYAEAKAIYDDHFSDDSGESRRGAVSKMSLEEFKGWLKGDTSKAVKYKEPTGKAERRQDTAQRKRIEDMTPEELRRAILTDALTGLPNRRAYEESEKLPIQVSADADSLKWVNDNMGHDAGDKMLQAIGKAFQEETEQAYHISGDEFVVQAATPEEAAVIMDAVQNRLASAILEIEQRDGARVTVKGIGISHGTGQTLSEAELGLQRNKQEREDAGLRSPRGSEPPGAVRGGRRDEGRQAAKNNPTAQVKKTAGQRSRERIARENPFLAFLAKDGISLQDRSDVGAEKGRRGNPLVPGFGPLFRRTGLRLDELALRAVEQGFLTQADIDAHDDNGGVNKLAEMIGKVVRGKEIIKTADEVDVGQQDQNEMAMLAEAATLGIDVGSMTPDEVYDAISAVHDEREAARKAVDATDADEYDALEQYADGLPDHTEDDLDVMLGTTDMDTAMRAMGFTEEEISNELARQETETGADSSTESGAGEPAQESAEGSQAPQSPAGTESAPLKKEKPRAALTQEAANRLAKQFREQGTPTEVVPHPTVPGKFTLFSRADPSIFYSPLARTVPDMSKVADKNGMISAEQASAWLAARQKEGKFKAEELAWSGLDDFLKLQPGKIAVADMEAFVRENGVQVKEVEKGATPGIDKVDDALAYLSSHMGMSIDDVRSEYGYSDERDYITAANQKMSEDGDHSDQTKYSQYVLPGAENYRELLLTLPAESVDESSKPAKLTELPEEFGLIFNSHGPEGQQWGVMRKNQGHAQFLFGKWGSQEEAIQMALPSIDYQRQEAWREKISAESAGKTYQSSHWEESNVLAHIRFNDRTDADGKRVLFIEEMQSDWAQQGKKQGFAGTDTTGWTAKVASKGASADIYTVYDADGNALRGSPIASSEEEAIQEQRSMMDAGKLPSAPFVTDTKSWLSLGIKRMIRYAAENGYDKVAFINGEQSADRYDLSKHVDAIGWYANPDDTYNISYKKDGQTQTAKNHASESELADLVGKDLASKIVEAAQNEVEGSFAGLDLKVGGDGMKTFYDKIVPQVANDVLKKLGGGKVGEVSIKGNGEWSKRQRRDGVWRVLHNGEETGPRLESEAAADRVINRNNNGMTQTGFDITPTMRDKAMAGMPLFRGGNGYAAGMLLETLQSEVGRITGSWQNAPKINAVQSVADLPFDAPADARGAFYQGQVWLVADNNHSAADAQFVLFHEVLGHAGLRGLFGADIVDEMKAIELKNLNVSVRAMKWRKNNKDIRGSRTDAQWHAISVEEALADMAGEGRRIAGLDRVMAAIQSGLRAIGLDAVADWLESKTDAEALRILADARRFIEHGEEASIFGNQEARAYNRGATALEENRPLSKDEVLAKQEADEKASKEGAKAPVSREKNVTADQVDMFNEQGSLFSRAANIGDLTQAQQDALRNVHGDPVTWKQKLDSFKATWKKDLVQGIFDQYAPILDYSKKGYILARMAKGGDSTLEAMLMYGKPYVDKDGAYRVEFDKHLGMQGFAKVIAGLNGEHDRFLEWVAANRAERLKSIGLENLYSEADIAALKSLDRGAMKNGVDRPAAYAKAMKQLNDWNDTILKIASDSGLIDDATRQMYKDQPYVPFYRLQDEGVVQGFGMKAGLVNQSAWKKLKGGTDKLNDDLLANLLQNWSHMITAAAKNRAAKETLDAAAMAGVAQEVPAGTPGKGLVHYMDAGQERVFSVTDNNLVDAIAAMHYAGLGAIGKPFIAMKRALTIGVTVNPAFKIRNLIRDSVAAIGTGELSYNPAKNLAQGFKATAMESDTRAQMLAAGGMIRFGSMLDGNNADRTRRLIEQNVDPEMILDDAGKLEKFFKRRLLPAFEAYQELGDRGEQINRAALYEQLLAKGMSHAEAAFWARDLMDFSMSGKWGAVRILTQTVPFMNARLQGLYKLGRAGAQDYKRMAAVLGAVSLASMALLLAYGGDDDWKKREDWDRDNFWWFKIGDMAFRLPKPFEIGAIGTLAERSLEYMTDNEMTGKRFAERVSSLVFNQLSMNPTPQLVKPLLDIYANKDSFSGRPIETMGMERLRKQDRATEHTSQIAKALGSLGLPDPTQLAMGQWNTLSPVQIDSLVRGYFGWIGSSTSTALDYGIRPMLDKGQRPDMKLRDVFLAGNFMETLPTNSSRYVTQMYEQAAQIEQAYGSYRDALKRGDIPAAQAIQAEEKDKLAQYHRIEAVKRGEAQVSAQIRKIEASKEISGDVKRAKIDGLNRAKDALAKALVAQ